ncbi:vacuolar protein sorting-associated protein 54-like [Ornithodoros turicata]|uniref:vacuolar protein sorting-associated protein 54-like n=1 Tax=Ornithodoros turicata TaxID=34597 RepID=UPI0031399B83
MSDAQSSSSSPLWTQCSHCPSKKSFKSPDEFSDHLRQQHCSKEGGSFVCRYGKNDVCTSLPVEGVSDKDYEDHVLKHHVALHNDVSTSSKQNQVQSWTPQVEGGSGSGDSSKGGVRSKRLFPDAVTPHRPWTIYDCSQNLPAVLNDPRKSRREADLFTKTWGDHFTDVGSIPPSPRIPEVDRSFFESYLAHTARRFRRLRRRSSSGAVAASSSGKVKPLRTNSRFNESLQHDVSTIPPIFMQPDFSLEDPETFNTVIPWSAFNAAARNSKEHKGPRQTSRLLQERLTHYLDIVEVQIAKQVSLRSNAFFQVMTSHDALSDRMLKMLEAVSETRLKLGSIDNSLVNGPLKVLQLKRSHSNHVAIYNKLRLIAAVHQTHPTVQRLLSTSDFVGALDVIETTREIVATELVGIQCLRHLDSQLIEIEKAIDKMMTADFLKCTSLDLNRPLSDGSHVTSEEHMTAVVFGMLRQKEHKFLELYKEEACTAVGATVKQTLIEFVSRNDDMEVSGNGNGLFEQVRHLESSKWLSLLEVVFENVGAMLLRIQAMHNIIIQTVNLAAEGEASDQSSDYQSQTEVVIDKATHASLLKSLADILVSICEHAHEGCAKLITCESKDGSLDRLSFANFVVLYRSIESFSAKCKEICKHINTPLRLALVSQANKFVNKFDEERRTKLKLLLESEQWKRVDIPVEFQNMVNHISQKGSLVLPQKEQLRGDGKPKPYLEINSEKYVIVGSALMMLSMILEYCQCVEDVPFIASDLLTRLTELLSNFNSRTSQLVLGAGALQLVGRKTITANILALSARSLQLHLYFLPKLKDHFSSHLSSQMPNMLKRLEFLQKEYADHVTEIFNKLVTVVDNMINSQLSNWEVKAPVPSPAFKAVARHLQKFHTAICEVLAPKDVKQLLQRMHSAFAARLRERLSRLEVANDGGPQHGLVAQELTFYTENLKTLGVTANFDDLWAAR